MQHKIFTIYDEKAGAYFPPFFLPTKNMAIREFDNLVNDPESQIHKHPQDYTLFYLGIFDDITAILTDLTSKVSLGNGLELKRQQSEISLTVDNLSSAEEVQEEIPFPSK
ncbi:Phage single stranded DNA synthesis |nr:Phage single stranded DNA synthesis \